MRSITIPEHVLRRAVNGPYEGAWLEFAVEVDWPELRLTEEQIIANALALVSGAPTPFPDPSIFSVRVPYAPRPDPPPDATQERDEAYAYLSRLLTHYAPECEPLPSLLGLCSQIDNLLVMLEEIRAERS